MLSLSYRQMLAVALPMMGASFVQSIVLLTDSAYLARYSNDAFAAVGNAGLIYVTLHMFVVGMSDGTQIILSRRIGENRFSALGQLLATSVFALVALIFFLFAFVQLVVPQLIHLFVSHQDIASIQIEYLSYRSYGLFFVIISLPIQAYYFAFGKSWVPLVGASITAVANIFLDKALIFGAYGFPELGVKGAAIASSISDGLSALFLISYLFLSKEHIKQQLFQNFKFLKSSFIELFRISLPIVFQGVVGLSTWTIFFIWLEQMGKFELTVSQNIRTIYFLAFVPIWGFAAATKTYISQYIGAKHFDLIPKIQRRLQFLTLASLFIAFHGAYFYPENLIELINPNQQYVQASADTLRYIASSMFMYGFFSVYFQTINGSGNTKITFYIEVVSVIVYIITAYIFIKVLALDVKQIWTVEYIYFSTIGLLAILYLRYFNWKNKVV